MKGEGGGEGKFSRTLNIFFFIHCTGLCLYRILIAREKTIPSLRCKNNIFNEKIPFLWDKFCLMCGGIKHYWSDCFWSINQSSTCKKCKINISKIRRGEWSPRVEQNQPTTTPRASRPLYRGRWWRRLWSPPFSPGTRDQSAGGIINVWLAIHSWPAWYSQTTSYRIWAQSIHCVLINRAGAILAP